MRIKDKVIGLPDAPLNSCGSHDESGGLFLPSAACVMESPPQNFKKHSNLLSPTPNFCFVASTRMKISALILTVFFAVCSAAPATDQRNFAAAGANETETSLAITTNSTSTTAANITSQPSCIIPPSKKGSLHRRHLHWWFHPSYGWREEHEYWCPPEYGWTSVGHHHHMHHHHGHGWWWHQSKAKLCGGSGREGESIRGQ